MRHKTFTFISIWVYLFLFFITYAQAANVNETEVARLYVATFNRAPLQAGLDYWANTSGLAIEDIARSFFDQPETQVLYPAGTSNTVFVTAIYQNLFNRDPLPAGLDYWIGPDGLGGSITRDVMILAVINGATGIDAETMANKTEVGLYYAASGLIGTNFSLASVTDDDATVVAAKAAIDQAVSGSCGAYVAPGVWKEFDCYNLAAIGKIPSDNPFVPSWSLIGGYWQWGRKGPDSSQWYDANTPNFAHGPIGPELDEANTGAVSGWDQTYAPNGSWSDAYKTANDPCPAGYRVPTKSQWDGVINNNTQDIVGSWSDSATDYSSARFFGNDLMLPAAGVRTSYDGGLFSRGQWGRYWSSTVSDLLFPWGFTFSSDYSLPDWSQHPLSGRSVRCIKE